VLQAAGRAAGKLGGQRAEFPITSVPEESLRTRHSGRRVRPETRLKLDDERASTQEDLMSQFNRRAFPVATVMAGAAGLVLAAAPASAKTTTLQFFQKSTSQKFLGANGKPTPPFGPSHHAKVGDSFIAADLDYAGSHKHHAARPSASDRLTCKFINANALAKCHGVITIGKSTLLADGTVNLRGNVNIPITGGTGAYAHAHGATKSVSIGNTNDSDFTVTFTT